MRKCKKGCTDALVSARVSLMASRFLVCIIKMSSVLLSNEFLSFQCLFKCKNGHMRLISNGIYNSENALKNLLKRQILRNSVKRAAVENICEIPLKLIG